MKQKKEKPETPAHVLALSSVVRNNANIRGITIEYLKRCFGEDINVSLLADRFIIIKDGLKREYHYSNKQFLECFTAAFDEFSNRTAALLDEFVAKEVNRSLPVED
jgi:hypothetical protein